MQGEENVCDARKSFYIGPTPCDEARVFRESRLKSVWQELITCLEQRSNTHLHNAHLVAGPDIDLFREALSCYQNGAFMATLIMCGAALESLLYNLVSAIRGRVEFHPEGTVSRFEDDECVYKLSFGRVLEEAKRIGLVNGRLKSEISEVRSRRNFAAHYKPRLKKEYSKLIDKISRNDRLELLVQVPDWVSEEEAYKMLERTAQIMCVLIDRAFSIMRKLEPSNAPPTIHTSSRN